MELPVTISFEEDYLCLNDPLRAETIRILDVDGYFLISVVKYEVNSKKMIGITEKAFDSLFACLEYLKDDLHIEHDMYEEEDIYDVD